MEIKRREISKIKYGSMEVGGPRHYYREKLIIKFITERLKDGLILDAGCGNGSLTLKLARRGYHMRALDLSDNFVLMVSKKLKLNLLNNRAEVRKGDITEISYENGTFDGIVSGEVLEHIEDDPKAVREFNRVLKIGGICVITVPANPNLWDMWDEMAGHYRRYHEHDIKTLFQDAGFVIEKVRFWGFPIMRLYHKLIYLPWAKQIINRNVEERENYLGTKIGMSKYTSFLLGTIFSIDTLFSRLSWGIGIILRARKIKNI